MTEMKQKELGLTSTEAKELQERYGRNELVPRRKENFFLKVLHIIREPMFLLLLLAAVIYFILGEPRDGSIMLVFVVGIIGIDVIQEWKTDKTLNALKDLSSPHITVIRDGKEISILSSDLVPGDVMTIQEGVKIPADGFVLKCNDLCVDESSLTGEALGVWKVDTGITEPLNDYWRKDYCYAGTLVTQGTGVVKVDRIGRNTEYGKIGENIAAAPNERSPLQKQTGKLVKQCAGIAGFLFVLVGIITYTNIPDHRFLDRMIESILSGITLAMAMIPEEFPVILTVFLSMGAWRLAKKKSLVRRLPSVETLGAVSVLCVDKTGTITMNQMTVQETWMLNTKEHTLCEIMGLACETEAYDPMEKAMLTYCESKCMTKEYLFKGELIKEYAFTNELKMMGHVWKRKSDITIAAKGSPERILSICNMTEEERHIAENKITDMAKQGLRVIAVASMDLDGDEIIPENITECTLTLCGLIGLADPPRESVKNDITICRKAGIRVVMITGDNGITASSIAKRIGMENCDQMITGDMLDSMTDEELQDKVRDVNIFSRVIPQHKMRIVKAFKENGKIVAMTGDGVNDAPALKYADIGIAMGKRGSEVSREAADLILMDDNFSTIVETVNDGRRIYDNIRKAIGYVFTIHIPIAFSSLLAPLLHIKPSDLLLLPLHVVLLELIIDPTCSIILERQPAEKEVMDRKPRNPEEKILTSRTLGRSVIQGVIVFAASFMTYLTVLTGKEGNAALARTMGLAIIMLANLFLVLVNSSEHDFMLQSMRRLAKDKVMWLGNILTIAGLLLIVYSPLNSLLKLAPLTGLQFLFVIAIAGVSVMWYEIVKLVGKIGKRTSVR
ncbi:MAG TPA: cation-translocating P-type ATPase [Lachnospiraceae bacterium]|nr:cation-translocating P-type ATPase [Lachnospiraceae bacterium]